MTFQPPAANDTLKGTANVSEVNVVLELASSEPAGAEGVVTAAEGAVVGPLVPQATSAIKVADTNPTRL